MCDEPRVADGGEHRWVWRCPAALSGLGFMLACSLVDGAQPASPATLDVGRRFIASLFSLSSEEVAAVVRGEILARSGDVADGREVATLGVMRLEVSPQAYAERVKDIARLKRGRTIVQIGVFSTPATLQDVAALSIESSEVHRLSRCAPGDCGFQLPAAVMNRFGREVNETRGQAEARVTAVVRQFLVDYVNRYRADGALGRYADESPPVDVAAEFRDLLSDDPGVLKHFKTLRATLLTSAARSHDTTEVIYWSRERLGRKIVLSVTHLVIGEGRAASPADYVICSKQLYASHYFDASLGMTVIARDGSGSLLAYLNRSRVDAFGGVFGGITRRIVRSRARAGLIDSFAELRSRMEGAVKPSSQYPFRAEELRLRGARAKSHRRRPSRRRSLPRREPDTVTE